MKLTVGKLRHIIRETIRETAGMSYDWSRHPAESREEYEVRLMNMTNKANRGLHNVPEKKGRVNDDEYVDAFKAREQDSLKMKHKYRDAKDLYQYAESQFEAAQEFEKKAEEKKNIDYLKSAVKWMEKGVKAFDINDEDTFLSTDPNWSSYQEDSKRFHEYLKSLKKKLKLEDEYKQHSTSVGYTWESRRR